MGKVSKEIRDEEINAVAELVRGNHGSVPPADALLPIAPHLSDRVILQVVRHINHGKNSPAKNAVPLSEIGG